MPRIDLNDNEKVKLIEALNNEVEPSSELLPKLFPSILEKFDVQKLDKARIPTIEYAGKRSKSAILAESGLFQGAPLQVVRSFGDTEKDEWRNLIVQGDNLQFLKTCYQNTDPLIKDKVKGKVKLIYIDPPFATKSEFGGKEGERSYSDKIDQANFLESLRERLIYLREILAEEGSIYVHLDQKMSHYVKVIMDEIFGKDNCRSSIVWDTSIPYVAGNKWLSNNWIYSQATIFYYIKSQSNYIFNKQIFKVRQPSGDISEKPHKDVWTDVQNFAGFLGAKDTKMEYPTQKPEALLERIIKASSNEGDIVLDVFAGSGTTLAVAEKLSRKWIGCDFGKHAIYTIQKRILNIGDSAKMEIKELDLTEADVSDRCEKCNSVIKENENYKKCNKCGTIVEKEKKKFKEKYGEQPKAFSVVSVGAYDFSKVMELNKNKDAYINFVLGLFQLSSNDKLGDKYKLVNIYGEKEGNPVEVYPVWDDNFLVNIRIDEDYLKQIIEQSGNKLKGDYYIITPETCTNVGDTVMSNNSGGQVKFKMLTFPYKILEDVSRNLQLEEQPSSQDNVNQLVNSTAFYFNEDVIFEVEKDKEGLKIKKFETKILNKEGNRFENLDGLAMVLIDMDYNDKIFDMDKTVFSKEIDKETGLIKLENLTNKVAVIAIDKHGNESKIFKVK